MQFAVNVGIPRHQLLCTLQLVCEDRLVSVSIFKFLYAGSSIRNASDKNCLVYPFVFCKLRSSSNPHKQRFKRQGKNSEPEIQTSLS